MDLCWHGATRDPFRDKLVLGSAEGLIYGPSDGVEGRCLTVVSGSNRQVSDGMDKRSGDGAENPAARQADPARLQRKPEPGGGVFRSARTI